MTAKVILSAERGSGKFNDRVLLLAEGEQVGVGRSTRELRPDTGNAVFDSRVLSKHQATLIFNRGEFFLRDSGSSNGSFINNFRLSKPGEQSLATQIYSKDTIRFGSQVNDKDKRVKEKCVVAKVLLFLPAGQEARQRPSTDRLYRPKEELSTPSAKDKSPNNRVVSFNKENLIENKVDKLEKIITEKLTEGQDDIQSLEKQLLDKHSEALELEEKVQASKAAEDRMAAELAVKKQEALKLADQLAAQAKEQLDSVKVTDLQADLEETKMALKKMTEEAWLAKERLRVETENNQKRQNELVAAQNKVAQEKWSELQREYDTSRLEVKQLNDLVSEADEIVKDKERELVHLSQLLDKDKMIIQERDGDYLDLKCLMTEENETVHQIESEMKRLLNIISEDQETILQKEKQIISLQKALRAKDEFLRKESDEVSNTKLDIEKMFQQTLEEKNEEINELEKEMHAMVDEKESEIFELQMALEEEKMRPKERESKETTEDCNGKDIEEANREMELLITANDALKDKMEDLMRIVEKKNEELEEVKEEMKKQTEQKMADIEMIQKELTKNLDLRESALQGKIEKIKQDVRTVEQMEATNQNLQKEVLVLKVQNQQKDLDIKCLQEMADTKDEDLRENSSSIESYQAEINRLKLEAETYKASEAEASQNSELINEKDKNIAMLQKKITDEQEASKQIEEELIQMKIEFDNLKLTKADPYPPSKDSLNDSEVTKLLKQKDHDIVGLRRAIQQEQEIVAHVQLTQEKEIIEKEREIAVLNAILTQERQTILDREHEIGRLVGRVMPTRTTNGLSPPARPKRNKGPAIAVRVPSRGGLSTPPVRIHPSRLAALLQATLPSPSDSPRLVTHHQNTLARMIQAASPTDDESTMTFHDALSDEEDVLIADLEMDDEEEDRMHRKSDIVDLDSVSLC